MINDPSFFLNSNWLWPAFIVSVIGVLVFVWKELSTPLKRGRMLRCILGVLAIGCLAAIALRPSKEVKATTQGIVLVTEGSNPSQVDSLLNADPNLVLHTYQAGSTIFPDKLYPKFIHVLGNGIAPFDLWQLKDIPTSFLKGKTQSGLVELSYRKQVYLGEELVLHGRYSKPSPGNQMILEGPDGLGIDSLLFEQSTDLRFELTAAVKVAGNYLFKLVEKDASGEVQNGEPIPVSIVEKEPLSILIVNTFPSFETKYLKNFIAEEGHLLTVRSQVTRGRFKYEYFNQKSYSEAILSDASLKKTDLLIMDIGAMNRLSSSQRANLRTAIQEEGLGLLVQPDPRLFGTTDLLLPLEFKRSAKTVSVINDISKRRLQRYSYKFTDDHRLEPIHFDEDNSVISGMKRNGKGNIGTTVLSNTYELQLGGQVVVYKKIWSELIAELSKKKVPSTEWTSTDIMAFENEPYEFTVRSAITDPIVKNQEGSQLPLLQDRYLSHSWNGTLYPRKKGWDQLQLEKDSLRSHFVYTADANSWETIKATQTIAANERFFSAASPPEAIFVRIPINRLWFFIPFLLCMGYLWFEPKWKN